MKRAESVLFMTCPMDYLESKICRSFGGEKYFSTTLGHRYPIDKIQEISLMVSLYALRKIILVSRMDSKIIQTDPMPITGNKSRPLISKAKDNKLYIDLLREKFRLDPIVSHLQKQTDLLRSELEGFHKIQITWMLYDEAQHVFMDNSKITQRYISPLMN